MSSASRRTNPSGTGCLYCPEAETVSSMAPTAQPVHFSAFAIFMVISSMDALGFGINRCATGASASHAGARRTDLPDRPGLPDPPGLRLRPPRLRLPLQELVRRRDVGHAHVLRVVLDLLSRAQRDDPEQHDLGELRRVAERTRRLRLPLRRF